MALQCAIQAGRTAIVRARSRWPSPHSIDSSASLPANVLCCVSRVNALEQQRPRGPKPLKQGLPLFVCMRFQDLFHSPPGVLFAFPSRYWFTIGRSRVFSLGGWSPHLQTGFHVPRPTCLAPSSTTDLSPTGLSPAAAGLSSPFG